MKEENMQPGSKDLTKIEYYRQPEHPRIES